MAVECHENLNIEGREYLSIYDSSTWADRGFCSACGSHVYYRVKRDNQYYIPVGIFDDEIKFEFERQIFIDRKPEYYCFENDTHVFRSDDLETAEDKG